MEQCEAALTGGASALQYRDKNTTEEKRQQRALRLANICRRYSVPFIVNDSPTLAQYAGADGVHLGRSDLNIEKAQIIMGKQKIIGMTCHNNLEFVRAAKLASATYCALGAVFLSPTKPQSTSCPPSTILHIKKMCPGISIIAIGGINANNIGQIAAAGADAAAVISSLFNAVDIEEAAQRLCPAFGKDKNDS
jgi:thiamine-phosphate pyrophosphorylase